ncbi:MAG: DNA alkylation repair protein [Neptuniibacter sp.]
MPEALKHAYNQKYLELVADEVSRHCKGFDKAGFLALVFDDEWQARELKARMSHIRYCLHEVLNLPFTEAVPVLCNAAPAFSGFEALFFPDYIEAYGQDQWDVSLPVLEWLTRFSSSELAVRPFIIADKERMMAQMYQWAEDDNYHVRRLASEGCRPRLPWAQALPEFKKNPLAILPVLEKLKADETDYVRRSVANNLNDIAKDNPEHTVRWAQENIGLSKHTDWIVKHGCRTLLKQAHPEILQLFGFEKADAITVKKLRLERSEISIGDYLDFSFELESVAESLGKLRVEYEIGYLKANGKHAFKVFMISEGEYSVKQKKYTARRSFKPMTTRKHYPGEHWLKVRVNGIEKECISFTLLIS